MIPCLQRNLHLHGTRLSAGPLINKGAGPSQTLQALLWGRPPPPPDGVILFLRCKIVFLDALKFKKNAKI